MDYLYNPELLVEHLRRVNAGEPPESIPFAGVVEVIVDLMQLAQVVPQPQLPGPGKIPRRSVSSMNQAKLITLASLVVSTLSLDLPFLIRRLPYEAQYAIVSRLFGEESGTTLSSVQFHRWNMLVSTPRGAVPPLVGKDIVVPVLGSGIGLPPKPQDLPSKETSAAALEQTITKLDEGPTDLRMYDDTSGTVAAGEVRCQLHFDLGVYYFMLGDLTRAAPYLTRALDLYDAKWAGEPAHDSLRFVTFGTPELAGFMLACDWDAVSRVSQLPGAAVSPVVLAFVQLSPDTAEGFLDACLADNSNTNNATPPPLRTGLAAVAGGLPWADDDFRAKLLALNLVGSALYGATATPTPSAWATVGMSEPATRLAYVAFRDAQATCRTSGGQVRLLGAFLSWHRHLHTSGLAGSAAQVAMRVAPDIFGVGGPLAVPHGAPPIAATALSGVPAAVVQFVRRHGGGAPDEAPLRQVKRLRMDNAASWGARLDILSSVPAVDITAGNAVAVEETLAVLQALREGSEKAGEVAAKKELIAHFRSAALRIKESPRGHAAAIIALALDTRDGGLLKDLGAAWGLRRGDTVAQAIGLVSHLLDLHALLHPTDGSEVSSRADQLVACVKVLFAAVDAVALRPATDGGPNAEVRCSMCWDAVMGILSEVRTASVLRLLAQVVGELHNASSVGPALKFDPEWVAASMTVSRSALLREGVRDRQGLAVNEFRGMAKDVLEVVVAAPWCPRGCREALGALHLAAGNTNLALRQYLEEVSVQSAFFQRGVTRDMLSDGLVRSIAQCLLDLQAYVQAVAVLQHESTVDYARAHNALSRSADVEKKQLRPRGCDEYLQFVYDAALLEVLLQQYKSSPLYRTKIISLLGRAPFSDGAVRDSAVLRLRSRLLEALANEYGA